LDVLGINERLEFLGDAMLSSVIAHLFSKAPAGDEGYHQNAFKIVSREHLNELGKDLNLVQYIESKVPLNHFGENIHGNIFESLVERFIWIVVMYIEKFIQKEW
jgi:ribonuclease-3